MHFLPFLTLQICFAMAAAYPPYSSMEEKIRATMRQVPGFDPDLVPSEWIHPEPSGWTLPNQNCKGCVPNFFHQDFVPSDFWPHRIRRSLNESRKNPSQEEIDALLLEGLDDIRNKTWLLPEFDFDDPQLPQLPKQVLLANVSGPLDLLIYLNAQALNEPKLRKHVKESCLNTDADVDNGDWCTADPKMNGNGGYPWYMKFTKSGTGLWQFMMTTSFRNSTDKEIPSNLSSFSLKNGGQPLEQPSLLADPELPEFPPALANVPKECRYFAYFHSLPFKFLITQFACRKNDNETSPSSSTSTIESREQQHLAKGWCKFDLANCANYVLPVYMHNTKHGVWFMTADCSLGVKNKFVEELLWNDQKWFFPN